MIIGRPGRAAIAEPLTKSLCWDVELKPVSVDERELPNYQSIVRTDNRHVLSVTKKSYHAASNEKFMEVVARIHEFTGFEVEGYGVFQQGRKVLAFLKNTEGMKIGDFDSQNYMVVGNSFDCSTGFFTGISNVVLRCTNQFSRISVGHNIRHNKQLTVKLDELVKFYKNYVKEEDQMKKTFEVWNQVDVDHSIVNDFVTHVLELPKENVSTIKKNNRESLFHCVNVEMAAMGRNAYGLFNGLTHYTSHVVKTSNKLFGNAMGHSYRLNERGYKFMNQLVP